MSTTAAFARLISLICPHCTVYTTHSGASPLSLHSPGQCLSLPSSSSTTTRCLRRRPSVPSRRGALGENGKNRLLPSSLSLPGHKIPSQRMLKGGKWRHQIILSTNLGALLPRVKRKLIKGAFFHAGSPNNNALGVCFCCPIITLSLSLSLVSFPALSLVSVTHTHTHSFSSLSGMPFP